MKILIVDDHTLIREALRNVIAELDPDAAIFEAASRQESETLTDANPDIELVLLDLGLPDGEGMDLLSRLRAQFPTLAVIVMSGTKDQATVTKALGLGAQGFIPKSAARPVMLNALRLVIEGGIYIPPEALERSGATPSPSHSPSLPTDSPQDLLVKCRVFRPVSQAADNIRCDPGDLDLFPAGKSRIAISVMAGICRSNLSASTLRSSRDIV